MLEPGFRLRNFLFYAEIIKKHTIIPGSFSQIACCVSVGILREQKPIQLYNDITFPWNCFTWGVPGLLIPKDFGLDYGSLKETASRLLIAMEGF